jgi:hypothetical protein
MTVRPFDWRDLPALYRYRNQCIFLDSARFLTRGPVLIPARALFSYFALTTGIFMYQSSYNGSSDSSLLGQVIHPSGKASARLAFLTPISALDSNNLPAFIEHVVKEIGGRGAMHLHAEVDEKHSAFESLRKAGFATFARQRIWRLLGEPRSQEHPSPWTNVSSIDLPAIRSLYANLVPGMVQQVEQPPPSGRLNGLVIRQKGELMAYVDIKYGRQGILIQPFIHPDVECISHRLHTLITNIPNRRSRPIYLIIRSYLSWLDPAIEDLGAEAGPRQAVMVRHLAILNKKARPYLLPAIENGRPEVSASITRRITRSYDTTSNNR